MKKVVDIANIDFYLYDFWNFDQENYSHLKKSGELSCSYGNFYKKITGTVVEYDLKAKKNILYLQQENGIYFEERKNLTHKQIKEQIKSNNRNELYCIVSVSMMADCLGFKDVSQKKLHELLYTLDRDRVVEEIYVYKQKDGIKLEDREIVLWKLLQ